MQMFGFRNTGKIETFLQILGTGTQANKQKRFCIYQVLEHRQINRDVSVEIGLQEYRQKWKLYILGAGTQTKNRNIYVDTRYRNTGEKYVGMT